MWVWSFCLQCCCRCRFFLRLFLAILNGNWAINQALLEQTPVAVGPSSESTPDRASLLQGMLPFSKQVCDGSHAHFPPFTFDPADLRVWRTPLIAEGWDRIWMVPGPRGHSVQEGRGAVLVGHLGLGRALALPPPHY